jgi:serine protease Do
MRFMSSRTNTPRRAGTPLKRGPNSRRANTSIEPPRERRGATRRGVFVTLLAALFAASQLHAADLPALWAERVKSVVAVEYVTETEVDRRPTVSMGTVIDANGTIILPGGAVDPRAATWQLKEFKVYLPGDATGVAAEYLGPDSFTNWHFLRVNESVRKQLTPITAFAAKGNARPVTLADFVWGIGLRGRA